MEKIKITREVRKELYKIKEFRRGMEMARWIWDNVSLFGRYNIGRTFENCLVTQYHNKAEDFIQREYLNLDWDQVEWILCNKWVNKQFRFPRIRKVG